MENDSESLLELARSGDAGAVEALLAHYLPGLRQYIRRRAGTVVSNKESSADIAQSVCREVLEHLGDERLEYRGEAAFRQWLYQAAELKLKNRRRYWSAGKRDARRELVRRPDDDGSRQSDVLFQTLSTPSGEVARGEERTRIEDALANLRPAEREVVELFHIERMSHREIGERLGISEANSRVRLARALVRLARLLESDAT